MNKIIKKSGKSITFRELNRDQMSLYRNTGTWIKASSHILFSGMVFFIIVFSSNIVNAEVSRCKNQRGLKKSESASLVIAEKGVARAVIVLFPGAGKPARFAAEELKKYLDKATGAKFIISKSNPSSGPKILVGESTATRKLGISTAELKRDGFILRRIGNTIIVAGRDDKNFDVRGFVKMTGKGNPFRKGWRKQGIPECATIFAAYAFLEKFANTRWYFPGKNGEFAPKKSKITITALEQREEPWFKYRWAYRYGHRSLNPKHPYDMNDYQEMGITDRDINYWVLRNRRSTISIPVNHMPPRHRFVARFGRKYPEWFSMRKDGSRENTPIPGSSRTSYGHLCYSNSDLVKAVINDVDAFFSGRSANERGLKTWNATVANGNYFSLLPHDYIPVGCHCPKCVSKKNKNGPKSAILSNLIWGYIAKVGQAIKMKHPRRKLVCLAYNAYRDMPQGIHIPENILPCPTALHTGNGNDNIAMKRIIKEIKGWKKIVGHKVCLWVYSAMECVDGKKIRGIPQTEFHSMGRFYRAVKNDIIGSFWENDWTFAFQHHLDMYIYHRVTWDPETNVDIVIKEYCRNLYGPAASEIYKFLNCVENLWTKKIIRSRRTIGGAAYRDIIATSDAEIWDNIYSPVIMKQLATLLDIAKSKTKGTEHAPRVRLFCRRYFGPLEARWKKRQKLKSSWQKMKPLIVNHFAVPPVIDGHPNDSAWKSIPSNNVGSMVANNQGSNSKVPSQTTTVKLGWDNRNLYVLVTCNETLINNLKAPKRKFNDLNVSSDDEVELFFDHNGSRKGYRHYLVNAVGSLANRYIRNGITTLAKVPGCQVKTWVYEHPERGKWYAEMAIPLGYHVPKPKSGDKWPANFVRSRRANNKTELSTWSPLVQGAFNQPENFGIIIFTDKEK